MLGTKPKLKYCGITLILSNPSRFDKLFLLGANGGQLFDDWCLKPEYSKMQCDIRLSEDKSPFLENTKVIICLGEQAMWDWIPETKGNSLNEMRGSIFKNKDIPILASYFPQDAADIKNYEKDNNEQYHQEEEDSEEAGDEKEFSATKRKNFAFWLRRDIWKAKEILRGNRFSTWERPNYRIYPTSEEVIKILTTTKNEWMDFDIETDYEEQNLLCFSFTFNGIDIYCVPILDNNYQWAYSNVHLIMRALAIAIEDNILVAHNGAAFDFFVLGYKYHIPINRTFDTVLAMHRCFPDIEKSLGHCTSYWTWEHFHKDSDSRAYFTREHMITKLKYCGKDVFTMSIIRKEILKYAKTIPGLEDSIKCAMDSIRPYLITTLQGIKYNQQKVDIIKKENDALMEQYLRIIGLLIGESGISQCKKQIKGKAKGFANSNTQCCYYFHELLGYPILFRSEKTKKPSLGKKIMYRLALKFPENPVIIFVLLYRTVAKEYSSLKFNPWKDDNGEICKTAIDTEEESIQKNQGSLPFSFIAANS